MSYVYEQSTGKLFSPQGQLLAEGYSGKGIAKNDPGEQDIPNNGPIPQGYYTIGKPQDTMAHGPQVLPLTPNASNEMYGRSGFLIHGDSVKDPGTASEGCIIMPRSARDAIAAYLHADDVLQVVAKIPAQTEAAL